MVSNFIFSIFQIEENREYDSFEGSLEGLWGNLVYDIYMFEKSGKVYVVAPTEDYMNEIPHGLTILSEKELEETGLTILLAEISKDKIDIARGYRDFD